MSALRFNPTDFELSGKDFQNVRNAQLDSEFMEKVVENYRLLLRWGESSARLGFKNLSLKLFNARDA